MFVGIKYNSKQKLLNGCEKELFYLKRLQTSKKDIGVIKVYVSNILPLKYMKIIRNMRKFFKAAGYFIQLSRFLMYPINIKTDIQ